MPVADVWVVDVERLAADGVLDDYRDVLSADELARLGRFSFDADRRAYLAAHGLARTALSARAPGVAAGAWRFRSAGHGRPEIAAPAHPGLRFNLSHTRRTVACVVTEDADCGVDVELVDGATDVDLLARGVLTAAERAAVDAAAPAERRTAFFRHWTLKEAYAKARGVGMSLPFDRYGFRADGTPALVEAPDDDDPGWRFGTPALVEAADDDAAGWDGTPALVEAPDDDARSTDATPALVEAPDDDGAGWDGTPALVEAPDDDGAGWRFAQWRHGASALVAVAVRPAREVVRHDTPPATITS